MNTLEEKVYNGENLSENELADFVYDGPQVFEIKGEDRRWERTNTTIFKIKDKYFAIDWEQGLTEEQEDSFNEQPYEVYKHTKQVTETKTWYSNKKED